MEKVLLVVVIVFSDKPTMRYDGATKGIADCYEQAITLAKAPPIDEDVVKYIIGCSFEDPVAHVPL